MQRRAWIFLGLLLCMPAIARATVTITAGNHVLDQEKAGQTFNILITADEDYTDGNARTVIAAGGPQITHINGDTTAGWVGNAGIVWGAGGSGGISTDVGDRTSPTDAGRTLVWSSQTAGFAPTQADGTYAVITVTTVGLSPGTYSWSLTAHTNGATDMFNGLDENFDAVPVGDLVLINGTLTIVPEPGTIALGLFAVAGLATVAIRRNRSRRAA